MLHVALRIAFYSCVIIVSSLKLNIRCENNCDIGTCSTF